MAEDKAQASPSDTDTLPGGEDRTGVTETRPLDTVVSRMIAGHAASQRGFVLSMAKEVSESGDTVAVEVRQVKLPTPDVDERLPLARIRAHQIHDTPSFIAFVKRFGTPDGSLITYNDAGFVLAVKELIERGQREEVAYKFVNSQDWNDWTKLLSLEAVDHKNLMRFLIAHEHNLKAGKILGALGSVNLKTTLSFNSEISDEGEEQGLIIKTNQGESLKKFPKTFDIVLPILDQDCIKPDAWVGTTVRIQINMPDEPKSPPTFTLLCSTWRTIRQVRLDVEAQAVRDTLTDYLIVNGSRAEAGLTYVNGGSSPKVLA